MTDKKDRDILERGEKLYKLIEGHIGPHSKRILKELIEEIKKLRQANAAFVDAFSGDKILSLERELEEMKNKNEMLEFNFNLIKPKK